jgi:hypothetical protein
MTRKACAGQAMRARARCVGEEYARRFGPGGPRAWRFDEMRGNAEHYRKEYVPRSTGQGWDVAAARGSST